MNQTRYKGISVARVAATAMLIVACCSCVKENEATDSNRKHEFLAFRDYNRSLAHLGERESDYIFFGEDSFSGDSLNLAFWNYRGENQVRGNGIMLRSNVRLSGDGILRLAARNEDGLFSGSMISTENSYLFKYGYFECRAKMVQGEGPDAGFWIQSPTNGATLTPSIDGVEVDIAEFNRARGIPRLYHALHWNGYGPYAQALLGISPFDVSAGYHIFGLEWTPREYVVYVDGVESARSSIAVSHRSQFIVLSNEIIDFGGNRFAGTYPDYFDVDYVSVYTRKSKVVLYEHCNYDGAVSADLNPGNFTAAVLSQLNVTDNAVSSIEVPPGWKVTLYSEDNFKGNAVVITSDTKCLTSFGFNDQVSSLIISQN